MRSRDGRGRKFIKGKSEIALSLTQTLEELEVEVNSD